MIKPTHFAQLLTMAALLTASVGCQTVNTAQRAEPQSQRDYIDDQRIVTDGSLNKVARIISLNEHRLENGRLRVQAQIQNQKKSKRTVHYRFEWLDTNGMVRKSLTSSWKAINIQGGQMQSISATATHADVVDFRLELIERKPTGLLEY